MGRARVVREPADGTHGARKHVLAQREDQQGLELSRVDTLHLAHPIGLPKELERVYIARVSEANAPEASASAILTIYSSTSRHSPQLCGMIGTLSLMPVTASMHITLRTATAGHAPSCWAGCTAPTGWHYSAR